MATEIAYTKATIDALLATKSARRIPVTAGFYGTAFNSVQSTAGTSRVPFEVVNSCVNPAFKWGNFFDTAGAGDTNPANSLPINAGIEISGVIYRLTFAGGITGTITPGGIIQCDPLGVALPAGLYYIRTYTSSTSWYPTHRYSYGGSGGFTANSDLTAPGSTTIADLHNSAYGLAPIAGYGLTTSGETASVLIDGDSLAHGQGDGGGSTQYYGWNTASANLGRGGFIARGLAAFGIGHINCGFPGELLSTFILPANQYMRQTFAADVGTVVCEYARNDLTAGQSLATIQANLLTAWTYWSVMGKRVYQTTITPVTTSTDNFITTINQTIGNLAAEAVRLLLNTWIRAGAPIVNGAAVAVGTNGALLAGQAGHPLYGYLEVADIAETARNSGVWNVNPANRTVSDGTTTLNGFNITAPDLAATAADLGRTIIVQGAGTAGGVYLSTIAAINSATSVACISSTPTAVSGTASIALYDAWTQDGTHPQGSYGSPQLAAAVAAGSYV